MTDIQELYFNLKYKNRILRSNSYLERSRTIKNIQEQNTFLKKERKKNLEDNPVTKRFLKESVSDLLKQKNPDISTMQINNIFDNTILFFEEYNKIFAYYNEARNDLFVDHDELVKWYKEQENKCGYCGITAEELEKIAFFRGKKLFKSGILNSCEKNLTLNGKRKRSKGTLEIERLDSVSNKYNFGNVILACPLCNNAKSNLIDEKGWRSIFVPAMKKYYASILNK